MRRRTRTDVGTTIHNFSFLMKVFMTMVLAVMVTLIDPEKQKAATATATPAPGDLVVEARWPDGVNVDVDLWVQGPLDQLPVGYSRRSDAQFSYLRDDVGTANDSTNLNYEFSFARGRAPGRYVVNVHLYSLHQEAPPVVVTVVAALTGQGRQEVAHREVVLTRDGDEVTAFSFELDDNGVFLPATLTDAPIPLRSGYQQPEDPQ